MLKKNHAVRCGQPFNIHTRPESKRKKHDQYKDHYDARQSDIQILTKRNLRVTIPETSIISSGAKDKQAIQRGAEQTSNSARRGTNKQLSEARSIQAIRGAAGQTSNCVFDQSSAFVAKIIYALFRRDPCMT